jgi:uncharacterized protein (TIGR00255 family)
MSEKTEWGCTMVKSMTGFGRSEITEGTGKITVEIKSVNNRFLDLSMKMPRKFNSLEAQIRSELKNYIQRGKVDVYITYEDTAESDVSVKYNRNVAAQYVESMKAICADFGLEDDVRVSTVARMPEVLTTGNSSSDGEELWEMVRKAIDGAGQALLDARTREGSFLKDDLLAKLDVIMENVDFISEQSPKIVEEYKEKLTAKVSELLSDSNMDMNRILQEVTIYSDKVCVDEELVRLRSHVQATRQELDGGQDGVGRKLDFLAQEMNREANTILSKTGDVEISARGIELKTEIEKVREQIQNVE